MTDNNQNPYGSGFTTDNIGSGFVQSANQQGSGFVQSADQQGSGFVQSADQQGSGFVQSADQQDSGFMFTDIQALSSQGAMSTVYKGKKYGKWHIIKRIKPEFRNNPEYRRLFLQEFDNGIQLDHPNIVRVEDKGEDSEGLWYSMEYVDGRSLDDMIRNRGLTSDSMIKNITLQLCDALSYVHKKQIVHRDLKPENILVTYRGDNVKILDFGLAHSDSYDDNMKKVGTPKYMAPEQITKGNMVDQRADIYALGLILLEMCTGDIKDREANSVQNPNFWTIIRKATQQNPADRYYNCQEIIDDLSRTIIKPAEPIKNPAPGPIKQDETPKDSNGKSKGMIIGAIAAAAAIAAIIFLMTYNSGSKTETESQTAEQTDKSSESADNKTNTTAGNTGEQKLEDELTAINDEIDAELDSQISALMEKANNLFDNEKNIAQAYDIYEQVLSMKPGYEKAQDRKNSCQKIFDQSNLYDMTPAKGPNGKYGYRDADGYVIVDYLYDNAKVNKNANWSDIITIRKNGKWGALNNRNKHEATDFIYDKAQWGIPGKRGFYLDITNGRRDQIYINSQNVIIYAK